jgi:flagellar biosynthesis/type III secretory pathway protein FliH
MKSIDEACEPESHPASHHFPTINNCCATGSDGSAVEGDQFRPLFKNASVSSDQAQEPDKRSATENRVEKARQKGYQLGFEAGRRDACQLAGNILSPRIDEFLNNLNRLGSYQSKIAGQASDHILQLALATAQCILGATVETTSNDLQTLRKPLMETINQQHQLALHYHSQDLAIITELMASKDITQWQSSSSLVVSEDDSVSIGGLTAEHQDNGDASLNEIVFTTLQEILNSKTFDR